MSPASEFGCGSRSFRRNIHTPDPEGASFAPFKGRRDQPLLRSRKGGI